ncbi:MAG: poly(R)-hydroxyalkanoic acid synthase subunit PhaE [Rhodanobacter sp.]
MADPGNDFMRDYQALAQQSWNAWSRQFQQAPATNPFAPPPAPAAGTETLERTLAGMKGYFDWMQAAMAGSGAAKPVGDWQQQLQQMFGGAAQPFSQAFGSIDSASAESFTRQWQSWLQTAQHSGFGDMPGMQQGATPAFGLNREQQMQQQTLAAAVMASLQASARYQQLIQRANTQGMQRMQDKLAEHAEPGRQIDSMKGLYDLWVDASEEAYADIALSEEFREVYGEMVNTQMRARQLQQEQTERLCRELGVPTRSEVSSLGERLQALRREFRTSHAGGSKGHADDLAALRQEVAALKRQLAKPVPVAATQKSAAAKPAPAAKKTARAKPAPAVKKIVRAKSAPAVKKAASKATRKPAKTATSRTGPRNRK